MKYLFRLASYPLWWAFILTIFIPTGILITAGFFIWHLSLKGCPIFEREFWLGKEFDFGTMKHRWFANWADLFWHKYTYEERSFIDKIKGN